MQPAGFNFQQDHFQLFGLPQSYAIDAMQLDQHYRALQAQVHPDKSAHLSETEQRLAMQHSTQVNEAYQTLRKPLSRARYLLSLHGVDTQEDTNTAMPVDFLMEQMEWREAVAEADDVSVLDELEARLHRETRELENELAGKLDDEKNYADAAGLVRKLRFMEKLAEEIRSAYDQMDT
ncbi:MAG TPA: Fe-S protein assembly co-chaperone HscB [Gallionella sp.]|nr:Fe-S protein assembly co-chaperone HscB [Gallionella sp.]